MTTKRRRKAKRATHSKIVSPRKHPRYLGPPNIEDRYLAWRFSSADIGGPFSCADLSHSHFQSLWRRLRAFEGMNVAQLRDSGSYHAHPTVTLAKEARARLQEINLDDIETLYSFHISGACRLWCIKYENVMSMLWWDEKHEVYPTAKKHT